MRWLLLLVAGLGACSSTSSPGGEPGGATDGGSAFDAGGPVEAGGGPTLVDGGYLADGGVIAADRFATQVISFTPGDCAGFGIPNMPNVVLGPPFGDASGASGSTDVVSLGVGGEIVLGFGDNAIIDGPGPDFIVFENAFYIGGNHDRVFAELAEVSVSEDGTTWKAFPCATDAEAGSYGTCAGYRPVFSAPDNGISPIDPAVSGGDLFDLAAVGLSKAKLVRIRDLSAATLCPADPAARPKTLGFDLDAISIVNSAKP